MVKSSAPPSLAQSFIHIKSSFLFPQKYILVKLATLLRIKTSENEQQSRSRRGTKLYRFKKSSRSSRRTDDFAVEVARKNLLIWQASKQHHTDIPRPPVKQSWIDGATVYKKSKMKMKMKSPV